MHPRDRFSFFLAFVEGGGMFGMFFWWCSQCVHIYPVKYPPIPCTRSNTRPTLIFVFQVCEVDGLASSRRGLSQIWQGVKKGSRKNGILPYKLATCWSLMSKYGEFTIFPFIMLRHGPIFLKKRPFVPFTPFFFLIEL